MANWKTEGALVNIKWKAGSPRDAWKEWASDDKVKWGWSTTGEWDCQIWVDAKTPAEAEKFVWDKVRKNQWVEDTESSWCWQWA